MRLLPCLLALALSAASRGQIPVFATDFNSGAPPEFSGFTGTEPVQGFAAVGCFSGHFLRNTTGCGGGAQPLTPTTLSLTQLPAHSTVSIGFVLAIIDTWDGLEPCCGPDYFEVRVDGALVFSASFKNAFNQVHPYSAPPGVTLATSTQLGFRSLNVNDLDSAFDMGNDPSFQAIPHTGSSLTIEWTAAGAGWHGSCLGPAQDESWAIDNVSVVLDAAPGQMPALVTVVGTGCGAPGVLPPTLGVTTLPTPSSPSLVAELTLGPAGSPAFLYASVGLAPVPLALGPGCNLYLDLISLTAFLNAGTFPLLQATDAGGIATFTLPLPPDLCPGLELGFQAAVLDGGAPLGLSVTHALSLLTL